MTQNATFLIFCFVVNSFRWIGQEKSIQSENKNVFNLISGNLSMLIDGSIGSRVISLELGNEEILGSNALNSKMYGSTLWLSPQGKWKSQETLDAGAYSAKYFNDDWLCLQSKPDLLNNFSFSKEFHCSKNDTSFVINYFITNLSEEIQEVAAWEVTRVPTGGLALFPKRSDNDIPISNRVPLLNILDSAGFIWYPFDSLKSAPQKIFMEGGEGWLAYVRSSVLFIKQFPVIYKDKIAPGESNVEIYVNKDKTYIELENQGEYQKLKPEETLSYEVKWYVRNLPEGVKADVGSEPLIKYIRKIIN